MSNLISDYTVTYSVFRYNLIQFNFYRAACNADAVLR